MAGWIHYLDADEVAACGCDEVHVAWTHATEHVTCPECQAILGARHGRDWAKAVLARIDVRKARKQEK
jgi:hypothetical protein